jgi:hypothetical protein
LTYLWPSAPWDLQHGLHTSELALPGTVHALLADLLYLHPSNTDMSNHSANPVPRRNRGVFARLAMRHANSLVCPHVDGKRRRRVHRTRRRQPAAEHRPDGTCACALLTHEAPRWRYGIQSERYIPMLLYKAIRPCGWLAGVY